MIADWLRRAVEPIPSLMKPPPIPEFLADAELQHIPHKFLRDVLVRYGEQFWELASRGVAPMFLGPPSVYKSYSAAVLCKAVHGRLHVPVEWCNAPVTLNQFERRRFDQATDAQIERWKKAPFLVVDDFAMVRKDSWAMGALTEIAMARFDLSRPTCWTGNVEASDPVSDAAAVTNALKDIVGAQITRRMFERSEGFRVYVR
jgi:DNA replication protein DnaC